jgi:hypothetical protein
MRTRFIEDTSGLLQVVVKEPLRLQIVNDKPLVSFLAEEKRIRMYPGQPMSRHTILQQSVGITATVAHHEAYIKQGLRGSQVDVKVLQGLRVVRKAP